MELRKKILALVEGQTEEALLTRTLGPHLLTRGVLLVPTILTTKRPVAGPSYKGGTVPWRRIKAEARNLLGDTSANLVTTMLDYYGPSGDGDLVEPGDLLGCDTAASLTVRGSVVGRARTGRRSVGSVVLR